MKLLRSPIKVNGAGADAQQEFHISSSTSPNEGSANSFVKVAGLFDSYNGDVEVTVSFA